MSMVIESWDASYEVDKATAAILNGDDRDAAELLEEQGVPTGHPYFTDWVDAVNEGALITLK